MDKLYMNFMEEAVHRPLLTLLAVFHQTQTLISIFPGKVLFKNKLDLEGKMVEEVWGKLDSQLQIVNILKREPKANGRCSN